MTPTRTRLLAATAAMILALPLFVVAAGRADANSKAATGARLLEIVITESPPTAAKDQTPHVVRIALSVAVADGGAPPAQVWTRSGTSTYRVQVSPLGRGATAQIEIERTDRSANNSGAGDLKLAASTQLAAGKTVLGRVDAHDGSRTEVMVTAP